MARITISGESQPEIVGEEEAKKIFSVWNDFKMGLGKNIPVSVNGRNILAGKIKEITMGNKIAAGELNLDDPADKDLVRSFETELILAQESAGDPKPSLEWYGRPHAEYAKKHDVKEKAGFVFNPMLGLVHWSWVKYAIKIGAIGRYAGKEAYSSWFVVNSNPEASRPNCRAYAEFMTKFHALRALMGRRRFAEEQGKRDLGLLLNKADEIGKMPEDIKREGPDFDF